LFKDELVLAVPRGHWLAARKYVDGRDLKEETLILNNVSALEREYVKQLLFGAAGGKVARVLHLPATEAVLELVQAGLGVSVLASFTLTTRVARGDLAAVRLTRRGIKRQWVGVFPQGSRLSRPIRTLLATLKAAAPTAKAP
jgi:DNA-binding transcriptional LysR family regulator